MTVTVAEILDAFRRRARGGRMTRFDLMCATDRGGAAAERALRQLESEGRVAITNGDGLDQVIELTRPNGTAEQLELFR